MATTPSKRPLADAELLKEIERLEHENADLEATVAQQHLMHQQLCAKATKLQQTAEVEEDHIANTLLRRLENEKREKKRCARMLNAEELAKQQILRQIAEVRTQQVEVENQVEHEQEFIVNQLQKDLMFVASVKNEAERALVKERMEYLNLLHRQVKALSESMSSSGCGGGVEGTIDAGRSSTTAAAHADPMKDPPLEAVAVPAVATAPRQQHHAASSSSSTDGTLVYELEKELNELLTQQIEVQSATLQQDRECTALAAKLAEIQQEALVDRSRAAKLKGELEKAKHDLAMMHERGYRSTPTPTMSTPVQQHPHQQHQQQLHAADESSGTTPQYYGPGSSGGVKSGTTLRSRTLELLSTPTIGPVVRRRTTSECSIRSTSPSAPLSGYTTDGDMAQMYAQQLQQQQPKEADAMPSRSSSTSQVVPSPVLSPH